MKRLLPLFLLITLCCSGLYAQNADTVTTDTREPFYATNQMGDKYIKMSVSPTFPLGFFNQNGDISMYVGGLFGLGFHIFLTDNFSVGGDAGFGFNITVGSNVFNYIPIVATATWQFQYKKWEFPLTAGVGFAWELYNGYMYWPGLILEAQAGAQYRIDSNWAAGGEITYMFMPQINQDPSKSAIGHFIDVSLLARYYF
ncbi:MAG: hypothetical protein IIT68_07395 [Treponema sp.]|nr:hypothetical protein [Treponema sp.]